MVWLLRLIFRPKKEVLNYWIYKCDSAFSHRQRATWILIGKGMSKPNQRRVHFTLSKSSLKLSSSSPLTTRIFSSTSRPIQSQFETMSFAGSIFATLSLILCYAACSCWHLLEICSFWCELCIYAHSWPGVWSSHHFVTMQLGIICWSWF